VSVAQRQVFSALSQIAKHNVDLAEMVVEADIFPSVLTSLKDPDEYVKKNTATLIREIAKHTPEVKRVVFCKIGRRFHVCAEVYKRDLLRTKTSRLFVGLLFFCCDISSFSSPLLGSVQQLSITLCWNVNQPEH